MSAVPTQPAFAAALLDARPTAPAGLQSWNGSDPAQRFAVYRNNMRMSLAGALAEGFPVLRQLLGEEFFQAMAVEYVQASPPRSPVLIEYGEDLADFIAGFAPTAELPYLADVARLEYLRVQAFHAADAPVALAQQFQAWLAQPERLPGLRLQLHPSLRLLRSSFAVLSLWQAHQLPDETQRDAALADLDLSRAEDILIWRPQFEVRAAALPPGALDVLLSLQNGDTLGQALDATRAVPGFALQSLFDRLVHDGLVTEILS